MGSQRLDRLVEPDALARLVDAARDLVPGAAIEVRSDGEQSRPSPATVGANASGAATPERAVVPIRVGDLELGSVEVAGGGAGASAVASFLARALEAAAGEGLQRRAIDASAIDELRESTVLARLSEMLGGAVDPDAIAGCTLETIARAVAASVGIVLGPDGRTELARLGEPDGVAALRVAAAPLADRLRVEDPGQGTCTDAAMPPGVHLGGVLVSVLRTARGEQGTIALGRPAGEPGFSAGDRRLAASVAGQAAVAIERTALQQQVAERRVLDRELEIGRRIQLSLMPRRFPVLDGWEIASAYEPAREVGGDFYDAFRLRDQPDRIGLVVADVSGKGIPAALMMADSRALIHAAADHGREPAEALRLVNRILVTERASGLFVTVAHGVLDGATGALQLASAGHDPVHIVRADGSVEVLDPPGRMVGMTDDLDITTITVALAPGDAWVGHTDGVTEARASDGSFYGEDRYRTLLASLPGRSAEALVAAIVADVTAFRGDAEPSDDLTILVARRRPDHPGISRGDPG